MFWQYADALFVDCCYKAADVDRRLVRSLAYRLRDPASLDHVSAEFFTELCPWTRSALATAVRRLDPGAERASRLLAALDESNTTWGYDPDLDPLRRSLAALVADGEPDDGVPPRPAAEAAALAEAFGVAARRSASSGDRADADRALAALDGCATFLLSHRDLYFPVIRRSLDRHTPLVVAAVLATGSLGVGMSVGRRLMSTPAPQRVSAWGEAVCWYATRSGPRVGGRVMDPSDVHHVMTVGSYARGELLEISAGWSAYRSLPWLEGGRRFGFFGVLHLEFAAASDPLGVASFGLTDEPPGADPESLRELYRRILGRHFEFLPQAADVLAPLTAKLLGAEDPALRVKGACVVSSITRKEDYGPSVAKLLDDEEPFVAGTAFTDVVDYPWPWLLRGKIEEGLVRFIMKPHNAHYRPEGERLLRVLIS